jgi:hypothetical protein
VASIFLTDSKSPTPAPAGFGDGTQHPHPFVGPPTISKIIRADKKSRGKKSSLLLTIPTPAKQLRTDTPAFNSPTAWNSIAKNDFLPHLQ